MFHASVVPDVFAVLDTIQHIPYVLGLDYITIKLNGIRAASDPKTRHFTLRIDV